MHDAGIVEDDVQPPELLFGSGDHGVTVARLRDVGRDRDAAAALECRDGIARRGDLDVDRHDAGAVPREKERGLTADAAAGARDQCDLAFKAIRCSHGQIRSK